MAEANNESIKHRLRKCKENQNITQTRNTTSQIFENNSEEIVQPVSTTITNHGAFNIEIVDTPFDPENIIIQITGQPSDQIVTSQTQYFSPTTHLSQQKHISVNRDDSSRLKDVTKDPSWSVHAGEIDKNRDIGTVHSRGTKQVDIDKEEAEEKRRIMLQKRNIRKEKKDDGNRGFTQLEILEAKNKELQENEKVLRNKVERSKGMYVNAIKEGKIKFSQS